MEEKEVKPGVHVIHKENQTIANVTSLCKYRVASGVWVDGVIYEMVEQHTHKNTTLCRDLESFLKTFELDKIKTTCRILDDVEITLFSDEGKPSIIEDVKEKIQQLIKDNSYVLENESAKKIVCLTMELLLEQYKYNGLIDDFEVFYILT